MRANGIHSPLHCISGHKNLNGGKSSLRILIVTFALVFACDLTFGKAKNVTLKIRKGVRKMVIEKDKVEIKYILFRILAGMCW